MIPVDKNNFNCSYEEKEMKVQFFCNNDNKALLKFVIYHEDEDGEDPVYGFFTTTYDLLLSEPNPTEREHVLWDKPNEDGKPVGILKFSTFSPVEKPSFSDYLKSGWKINMSVAIDFTASNKDPSDPESLHAQRSDDPNFKNDYERVIEDVGAILESYAYNN